MVDGVGFCHKCGAQLPQGATFCPRCGAAAASSASPQSGPQQPATAWRNERREKHEKGEKHEKNEKAEKGGGGGMLGPVVGGLVIIWLGTTFYLEQNGYLASDIWWAYFISGIGVILILEGVVIYSRGHVGLGPVIGGAILVFAGVSSIATSNFKFQTQLWPLFLVAIGFLVLLGGISSRRRVRAP
jgi:hypothetical protein